MAVGYGFPRLAATWEIIGYTGVVALAVQKAGRAGGGILTAGILDYASNPDFSGNISSIRLCAARKLLSLPVSFMQNRAGR